MTDTMEMPRYQCHKRVWALKIKGVVYDQPPRDGEPQGNVTLIPEEDGYSPVTVDAAWAEKHRPQAGGYFVVYDDGYKSYSPANAFESGYTLLQRETAHL
jgi:hypothetical protein